MTNIHFRSVNFKADKKLKEFAKKRIEKLSLFYNQILEVFVFTKIENNSRESCASRYFHFNPYR